MAYYTNTAQYPVWRRKISMIGLGPTYEYPFEGTRKDNNRKLLFVKFLLKSYLDSSSIILFNLFFWHDSQLLQLWLKEGLCRRCFCSTTGTETGRCTTRGTRGTEGGLWTSGFTSFTFCWGGILTCTEAGLGRGDDAGGGVAGLVASSICESY